MFGYVMPLKEELKIREYEIFRSYYCGLCQHIKQTFGHTPRLVLNYDLTCMGILLDSLNPHKISAINQGCIANPLKRKKMITSNKALDYTASINVILAYYKILDDVKDDNSVKSKALAAGLAPFISKLDLSLKYTKRKIKEHLNNLARLEHNQNFNSLDEIAHPFAMLVGDVVKDYPYALYKDSTILREQLFQFGYVLGKWIYIIDALDDFPKDVKNNNFNPFYKLYYNPQLSLEENFEYMKDKAEFTLLNCGATCKNILNELPLKKNKNLLNNIVVLGMMDKYMQVSKKCSCKKSRRKK
ncbi:hypothetical protein AN396_07390 [Candidatus Epulonipiscium fishelsonii]|uniref:Uncharacterized protein n=1 Tax=Candidatus Epulonipiscium fishelsonii TaxID=77094 RepID=A0ACC8XBC2_9FIRM|nr:hypothetical protein AN396_07390 [Epulopiscium sp. SCG-B11WGA-EpuloA1]